MLRAGAIKLRPRTHFYKDPDGLGGVSGDGDGITSSDAPIVRANRMYCAWSAERLALNISEYIEVVPHNAVGKHID